MASSLNKVFLMGNLTRDPELRYIPSGTAVATFGLAVNRRYTSATGEKKEDVAFLRIVVWGRRAEVCGEYLSKGSPIFVEGRLQSRSWEGNDGVKRSTVEIVADNIQFLGRGKGASSNAGAGASPRGGSPANFVPQMDVEADVNTPVGNNQGSKPVDGSSDEVPF